METSTTLPKMLKVSAETFGDTAAQITMIRKRFDKAPEKTQKPKKRKKLHDTDDYSQLTYREFFELSLDSAAGLLTLGVERGDNIGIISDNRAEWQQLDMGILTIGAIDVPRGCDATRIDIEIILGTTHCKFCAVENSSQLNKILDIMGGNSNKSDLSNEKNTPPLDTANDNFKKRKLCDLTTIIMLEEPSQDILENANKFGLKVVLFQELLKSGQEYRIANPDKIEDELEKGTENDTACIIFTSGTTGTPKGVVLTHKNFLAQLDELPERIILNPGERTINVLPIWHVFERACEYVVITQGATLCYSKPIGSILLSDFQKLDPVLIPAVPRIFESIYDGIMRKMRSSSAFVYGMFRFFVNVAIIHSKMQRKMFNQNTCFTRYYTVLWWFLFLIPWVILWPLRFLGGLVVFRKIKGMLGKRFRYGVVGGGAYPRYIDEFFWAIGIKVVEGYGLTETAPVISVRPVSNPIFGNVGSPIRRVKARIVSIDDGFILPRGKFGAIQISGDTVMKGYYKNKELTDKAISADGWLDTGDLGYLSIHDELVITGRKKDTIVLRGGENVEPAPIEMQLSKSRYIKLAVVVGQDERSLGALILIDEKELKGYISENGLQYANDEELLRSDEVHNLYESEISALVNPKNGFKLYERINKFCLITKDFEVGVELSAKQEVMRYRISEIYKKEIANLFTEYGA